MVIAMPPWRAEEEVKIARELYLRSESQSLKEIPESMFPDLHDLQTWSLERTKVQMDLSENKVSWKSSLHPLIFSLFEVKLLYNPVCLSGWSIGWLVGHN